MKIQNSTKWSTKQLVKLFLRCVKEVDKIEGSRFGKRKRLFNLIIKNTSYMGIGGRATVNGFRIKILLGRNCRELDKMTDEFKMDLAKVMIHEYYHIIGYKHQDKMNYRYDFTKRYPVEWAKDYEIGLDPVKEKPQIDHQEKRYLLAQKNLVKAETRFKRTKTLFQKWQLKVGYYEKVFAKRNEKSN